MPAIHRPSFLEIEKAHFLNGKLPRPESQAGSADEQIYLAEIEAQDARRAEGIALMHSVHPLLKARAFTFRGSFDQAQEALNDLEGQPCEQDPGLQAEILLERARTHNFQAQWSEAIALVNRAFELTPYPTSLPALYQVRGNALYELGEMRLASGDLERVLSLAEIFPHAVSRFYAEIYLIRITARDQGPESARKRIRSAWQKQASEGCLTAEAAAGPSFAAKSTARASQELLTHGKRSLVTYWKRRWEIGCLPDWRFSIFTSPSRRRNGFRCMRLANALPANSRASAPC